MPSTSPSDTRFTSETKQIGQTFFGETVGEELGRNIGLFRDGTVLTVPLHLHDSSKKGADVGRVQVFRLENDEWVQNGQDLLGDHTGDQSGYAMDCSDDGSIVAIGAWTAGSGLEGIVRVYQYNEDFDFYYRLVNDIRGVSIAVFFGSSVSLSGDGNTLAIGVDYLARMHKSDLAPRISFRVQVIFSLRC